VSLYYASRLLTMLCWPACRIRPAAAKWDEDLRMWSLLCSASPSKHNATHSRPAFLASPAVSTSQHRFRADRNLRRIGSRQILGQQPQAHFSKLHQASEGQGAPALVGLIFKGKGVGFLTCTLKFLHPWNLLLGKVSRAGAL
jgi:hypothetical protein